MPKGVYIHVPFCRRKCPYCDFYSVVADDNKIHEYAIALIRNIQSFDSGNADVDTIYFGGGTPSLMSPEDIADIIGAVKHSFNLLDNAEITLEANPCTVDFNKLCAFKQAGINRISFGVQSSNDSELSSLGRLHNFTLAEQAVMNAKAAGFDNISCDLMIGTPKQTLTSLDRSIDSLASLGIQHISAYMLKIEEGTAYDCDAIRSAVADDDTVSDMYLSMCDKLDSLGYKQYEISNFSLLGYESRHNLKYWQGDDYIGFGPAAHSLWNGKRFFVSPDLEEYLKCDSQAVVTEDDSPNALEEYIMLSLRLTRGLSLSRLEDLGGNSELILNAAQPFIDHGYVVFDENTIHLTPKGFLVSNEIILELIMSQS